MKPTFRIVICTDIEAENPDDAYKKLTKFMSQAPSGITWESTDEWYDDDLEQMPIDDIKETISRALTNK